MLENLKESKESDLIARKQPDCSTNTVQLKPSNQVQNTLAIDQGY